MTAHESRVTVPPVTDARSRPLWSILIPTFNCAAYLKEALSSVLAQDEGPDRMEIIVVDDHSTLDDPESVVKQLAQSRVRFIRQDRNVGKVRNYESGLVTSRGKLIHQLHGDDRVLPGFYKSMADAFERFPAAGAFFCEAHYIDESGKRIGRTGRELSTVGLLDEFLEKIFVEQRIQTPSIVVRRDVYEILGGFDRRLDAFEDWEMWIRIAGSFPMGFIPEVLAEYRASALGTTSGTIASGRIFTDMRDVRRVVDESVSKPLGSRLRQERDRAAAQYFTQLIPTLLRDRHYAGVARVYIEALSYSFTPRVLYRLVQLTRNHGNLRS